MYILKLIKTILPTCGGLGYSPLFPGAVGTILGFLIALLSFNLSFWWRFGLTLILVIFALPLSTIAENLFQEKDSHKIIIDEVIGVLVASLFLRQPGWQIFLGIRFPLLLFLAMLLFGLFDGFKPFPANKLQDLPGGWGIILDDIVAGLYAGLIIILLMQFFF